MKRTKIWGITLICLIFSNQLLSQSFGWNVDAYISYPGQRASSVQNDIKKEFVEFNDKYGKDPEFRDFEVTTPIPKIGVSVDYFFSSRNGFKVDFNLTSAEIQLQEHSAIHFNEDFTEIIEMGNYDHNFSSVRISALAAYSYYLWFNKDISIYSSAGLGFNYTNTTINSTFPIKIEPFLPSFRIAIGLGLGARYYFTDHIGINVLVGAGALSRVSGGISYHF